jgi:hypothetical protein
VIISIKLVEYNSKMGLKALSEHFLGFSFPTDWTVRSRGWEDTTLRPGIPFRNYFSIEGSKEF